MERFGNGFGLEHLIWTSGSEITAFGSEAQILPETEPWHGLGQEVLKILRKFYKIT